MSYYNAWTIQGYKVVWQAYDMHVSMMCHRHGPQESPGTEVLKKRFLFADCYVCQTACCLLQCSAQDSIAMPATFGDPWRMSVLWLCCLVPQLVWLFQEKQQSCAKTNEYLVALQVEASLCLTVWRPTEPCLVGLVGAFSGNKNVSNAINRKIHQNTIAELGIA